MFRERTYIAVFLILVCGSLLASYLSSRNRQKPVEILPVFGSTSVIGKPLPQRTQERVWRNQSFQRTLSIGGLNKPANVRVDPEGNIFIFDWGNLLIKKISKAGALLLSYGKGLGDKPGQFLSPTDFTLLKEGGVLVCDPKGSVTLFNANGEVEQTVGPKNPAMRVARGSEGFVTMPVPTTDRLFETYDDAGNFISSFGEFVQEQSKNALSLMGWIVEDLPDGFIYAAQYAGILASYKMDGELRFFVQTIDPVPLPTIKVMPSGVKKLDYSTLKVSALSVSVVGDEIYLTTQNNSTGSVGDKIIDVYSTHDGTYLYSSHLPEACERAYLTDFHLYSVGENKVNQWQWRR